ncbi:MAG: 16S rRNA (cytidine(1402)-2'-O)-methyltransferase [Bacteriovoracaceae bacterium]
MKLTLLSVPIGNLGDITQRVLEVLKTKKNFIVEDTRSFKNLMQHLKIDTSEKEIYAFHDHSAPQELDRLTRLMKEQQEVYFVSEAGSPIISDPAYPLVIRAIENGISVDSCPGPSSILVALELSGLPPHPFCFHGFIARENKDKEYLVQKILQINQSSSCTHILFESPFRILDTLDFLYKTIPTSIEVKICLATELTKMYQRVERFFLSDWETVKPKINAQGEFILMIYIDKLEPTSLLIHNEKEIIELAQNILENGNRPKSVAKLIAKILNEDISQVYQKLNREN